MRLSGEGGRFIDHASGKCSGGNGESLFAREGMCEEHFLRITSATTSGSHLEDERPVSDIIEGSFCRPGEDQGREGMTVPKPWLGDGACMQLRTQIRGVLRERFTPNFLRLFT